MSTVSFPLDDPEEIFGNDAAEDEAESVFTSYALYRPEISSFVDAKRPLQVVRSYKGEGKSALLRLVEAQLKQQAQAPIVIKTTGQSLSPTIDSQDSDQWVREWKRRILQQIASEIGSSISFAFSDDAITLVHEAEMNGFKARSFVSSITDRLKSKAVPLEQTRPPAANSELLLKRWLDQGSPVWVLIDDLDQNFRNEPLSKLKVATCFIAVRQIFSQIPEIRFRLAVRPNVWSIVKFEFEALSHVEQYMVDLPWTEGMFLDLIARRVESYLQRTGQWAEVVSTLSPTISYRYEQLLSLLFEDPVPWGAGGKKRPMQLALHTLSRHRPRWLIELCKVSAARAHAKRHKLILLEDVVDQLDAFGKKRIEDMVAEFRSQCEQIEALIFAFSGQNERFATNELLSLITNRIMQGVSPRIVGMNPRPTNKEVASFLFQIGFLSARLDHPDGSYDHLSFADRPNLLRAQTNIDEGVSWEIHPVFRNTLRTKDVESKSEQKHRGR